MIGNVHALPWSASMRAALGLSLDIKDSLVFQLDRTVDDAEYPNKIGDQDRVAAGGEVFPGRANAFDGLDQEAHVADNGALDVNQASTDFCITAEIEIVDLADQGYIFGKAVAGARDGRYGLYQNTGSLQFLIESSGGLITIVDNISLAIGRYSIVVRVDRTGKLIYFYIDGVLQNAGGDAYTGTIGTLPNEYEFVLGGANVSGGAGWSSFWNGNVNDVRIYHKDVTSAANLASLQKGEALGDEVAWWFCEGTDLLEVFDASGNGYHMTAGNFDSTSFVEGNWQSLMNKYGYAIDVGDLVDQNVSNCENSDYTSFANATPTGFDATSNGTASHEAGTADEISFINGSKILVSFDMVLNSGTAPNYNLRGALAGALMSVEGFQIAQAGHNIFVFTANTTTIGIIGFWNASTTTDYEITNLSAQVYYDTAILPDMSTVVNGVPTHDIFGNTLTFAGQAKYNAIARDRSCFIGDEIAYWDTENNIVIDPDSDDFEIEFTCYLETRDTNYSSPVGNVITTDGRIIFNNVNFYFCDDDNNILSAWTNLKAAITTGWQTIKFIGNGTNISSYHEGVLMDTLSASSLTAAMTFDQVMKGGGAVTPSWYRGVTTKITVNGSVVGNWQFVEGNGNTVHDVEPGSGNHLTGISVDDSNWGVIDTPEEDYLAEHGGNFVGVFASGNNISLDSAITIDRTKTTIISFRAKKNDTSSGFVIGSSTTKYYKFISLSGDGKLIIETNTNEDAAEGVLIIHDIEWHEYEITIINSVVSIKQDGSDLTMNDSSISDDITINQIGLAGSDYNFHGNIASVSIVENGIDILNVNITGFSADDSFGTWNGDNIHSAIIPALSDKSADALGQTLVYPQGGKNLIPQCYVSFLENIKELYDADQAIRWEGGLMDD